MTKALQPISELIAAISSNNATISLEAFAEARSDSYRQHPDAARFSELLADENPITRGFGAHLLARNAPNARSMRVITEALLGEADIDTRQIFIDAITDISNSGEFKPLAKVSSPADMAVSGNILGARFKRADVIMPGESALLS